MTETNNVVRLEIERFARYIQKALKYCEYPYPENTPLSITGGGLGTIRGATEYLSECINRETEYVKPEQPMLERPQLASALGVLNMVLLSGPHGVGFFGRVKRFFSKK